MSKRVLAVIVLLVAIAGSYLVWRRGKESRELGSGGVHGLEPAKTGKEVPADGAKIAVTRQDEAAPVSAALPATDSSPPDPPNGMLFGGKGTYQWYRQGDITWRLDTASGRSCIVFATMEEWRKQIVYSHGCGRNA